MVRVKSKIKIFEENFKLKIDILFENLHKNCLYMLLYNYVYLIFRESFKEFMEFYCIFTILIFFYKLISYTILISYFEIFVFTFIDIKECIVKESIIKFVWLL